MVRAPDATGDVPGLPIVVVRVLGEDERADTHGIRNCGAADMRKTPIVAMTAGVLLLAGCSFSAGLTASPEAIEDEAAQQLKEAVGVDYLPEMDCGDDDITIEIDKVIDCELTDADGTEYDATVTITSIDGTNFGFDVEVADTPND